MSIELKGIIRFPNESGKLFLVKSGDVFLPEILFLDKSFSTRHPEMKSVYLHDIARGISYIGNHCNFTAYLKKSS